MTGQSPLRWVFAGLALALAVGIAVRAGLRQRQEVDPGLSAQPPAQSKPNPGDRELCAERLAKVGQALRAYSDDHEGAFPIAEAPDGYETWLLGVLSDSDLTEADLRCPAATDYRYPGYVYHCYESLGDAAWPRWMPEKHVVTAESDPDTWLMADTIAQDRNGPHSTTEKAFNYLCVDGHVGFQEGRPRSVYK